MRSTIFLTLFTHLSLLIAELEHVRPCSAYQHLNPTTFRCCGKRHVSEGVTPIVSASLRDRNPRSSTRKLLRKPWEAALSSNIINANDRRRSGIQGTGDRGMGMRAAAMDTTTVSGLMSHTSPPGSRSVNWPLWYVLPIAPYQKRKTIMEEIVPGKVWTFDQLQGILYVIVPVRMTVIKLQNTPGGGLFVYAPVAPTGECMTMIRRLEAEHGPVRHIVLGTLGLEHKVFAGPFAQRFKEAQVWYTPGQYSFPIGLPLSWLGFGGRPTKEIPASASDAPWSADLDHAVLGPFFSKDGSGGYGETAFFHKDTKTLLVTDMVVKIEDQVPEIVAQDPRPLLFHARDNALERVEDTPEVRLKGWRRIVQFALTFQPSSLVVVDLKRALFEDAPRSKMKELGWGGLFPFEWKNPVQDAKSFDAFKGGLLVAPILQVLLLNRNPEAVLDWADRVARWPFRRVIPCHLANNVAAMPQDFRNAFRFLEKGGAHVMGGGLLSSIFGNGRVARNGRGAQPLDEDLQFLRDAEKTLVELGTLFPAAQAVDRSRR